MRIFLAMAMAASLFVAVGCSCATGDCGTPVVDDCNTCEAAPISYEAAPVVSYAAPAVTYAAPAPVVVETAPAPLAVAPITCNPCAGL